MSGSGEDEEGSGSEAEEEEDEEEEEEEKVEEKPAKKGKKADTTQKAGKQEDGTFKRAAKPNPFKAAIEKREAEKKAVQAERDVRFFFFLEEEKAHFRSNLISKLTFFFVFFLDCVSLSVLSILSAF